jgi:uncharacterized protein
MTAIYRSVSQINEAMSRVYMHMFFAVLTSFAVASFAASSLSVMTFLFTGFMGWVTILMPIPAVMLVSVGLSRNPSRLEASAMLHGFAAIMGLSLSAALAVHSTGAVISAFAGAAALFGLLSVFGYFTKKDLSDWGPMLFVALIAIIVASVVNIFVGSSFASSVISVIAILVFAGLTAYDTQEIRKIVSVSSNDAAEVSGALSLYLNFINIFLNLLNLGDD